MLSGGGVVFVCLYTLFLIRVTLKVSQTWLHKVPDIKQIQKTDDKNKKL